jgi:hypothetical protein
MEKNMKNFKGQAALDFLMTYGWALLLIVLAVGALFALGVFDISGFLGSRATGFAQVHVAAWRVDSAGVLTVKLTDQAGTDINVTNATWTYLGTSTTNTTINTTINNGQTSATLTLGSVSGITSAGTSYTLPLSIAYVDRTTSFAYQTSGTLTGKSG